MNKKTDVSKYPSSMIERSVAIKADLEKKMRSKRGEFHLMTQIVLDTADIVMTDFIDCLEKDGRFKHFLKLRIKSARRLMKQKYKQVERDTKEAGELLCMVLDQMAEETRGNIMMLTLNVENAINGMKMDTQYTAKQLAQCLVVTELLECAKDAHDTFTEFSILMFRNTLMRECLAPPYEGFERDASKVFGGDAYRDIYESWKAVTKMMYGTMKMYKAVRGSKNVMACLDVLGKQLANMNHVDDICTKFIDEDITLLPEHLRDEVKDESNDEKQ